MRDVLVDPLLNDVVSLCLCVQRPESRSLDRCLSDGGADLREQEGRGPAGCVGGCRD